MVAQLITQRRKQILVHSVLYYRMGESVIPDHKWNEWARELASLQEQYPDISANCPLAKEFENFDPATGFDLPLDNLKAIDEAQWLLNYHREREKNNVRTE